jgi:cell division protein FtsB
MVGKKKEVMLEGWKNLLELYQDEIEEEEKKTEVLRKEERHIKQEIEKLS